MSCCSLGMQSKITEEKPKRTEILHFKRQKQFCFLINTRPKSAEYSTNTFVVLLSSLSQSRYLHNQLKHMIYLLLCCTYIYLTNPLLLLIWTFASSLSTLNISIRSVLAVLRHQKPCPRGPLHNGNNHTALFTFERYVLICLK